MENRIYKFRAWDGAYWTEYIGKRLLISESWSRSCQEAVVIEVAPSGEFVKLRWPSGSESWSRCEEYRIREVLAEPEQGKQCG